MSDKVALLKKRGKRAEERQGSNSPNRALVLSRTTIRRGQFVGNYAASSAANTYGGLTFLLNALPGYTQFTALYQQYRFKEVHLRFIRQQTTEALTANQATTPLIYTVVDLEDSTSPTTNDELLEYSNVQIHAFYENFTITFKPRAAITATGGALVETGVTDWISTSNPAVVHYGLKYTLPQVASGNVGGWFLFCFMEFEFQRPF